MDKWVITKGNDGRPMQKLTWNLPNPSPPRPPAVTPPPPPLGVPSPQSNVDGLDEDLILIVDEVNNDNAHLKRGVESERELQQAEEKKKAKTTKVASPPALPSLPHTLRPSLPPPLILPFS